MPQTIIWSLSLSLECYFVVIVTIYKKKPQNNKFLSMLFNFYGKGRDLSQNRTKEKHSKIRKLLCCHWKITRRLTNDSGHLNGRKINSINLLYCWMLRSLGHQLHSLIVSTPVSIDIYPQRRFTRPILLKIHLNKSPSSCDDQFEKRFHWNICWVICWMCNKQREKEKRSRNNCRMSCDDSVMIHIKSID